MSLQGQLQSIVEKIKLGKTVYLTNHAGATFSVERVSWGGTSPTIVMTDSEGQLMSRTASEWKRLGFKFQRGSHMRIVSPKMPKGAKKHAPVTTAELFAEVSYRGARMIQGLNGRWYVVRSGHRLAETSTLAEAQAVVDLLLQNNGKW